MDAYNLREDEFTGLPAWADCHERYEIQAKMGAPDASEDQLRLMLQTLLADRFQLRVHRESKRLPVYELSIGKGGLKPRVSPDKAEGYNTPWSLIPRLIEGFLDYPLIDKTGIRGYVTYDPLKWDRDKLTAEVMAARPAGLPLGTVFHGLAPSIFHEVESTWGLTLKKVSAPSDFLVIEHVERPSAN